jgi:hypothetical protein
VFALLACLAVQLPRKKLLVSFAASGFLLVLQAKGNQAQSTMVTVPISKR